eukprot:snap_masked-scaffold_44-processed-gene-1.20-mRNA-1 protein AED:1.00 eAED:1.00 QI:0/-1/0/0/-1/1/1/0/456
MQKPLLSLTAISTLTYFTTYLHEASPTHLESSEKPKQLEKVVAIFRHGARTPVFSSPTLEKHPLPLCYFLNRPPGLAFDHHPYFFQPINVTELHTNKPRPFSPVDYHQSKSRLLGGCRKGQLTDLGAEQANELGKILKDKYLNILNINEENILDNLYSRSTNVARCVATLSGVLGGLIGDEKKTVEVKTMKTKEEIMYPNHRRCKRLRYFIAKGKKHFRQLVRRNTKNEFSSLFEEVEKGIGKELAKELVLTSPKFDFIPLRDWASSISAHKKWLDGVEFGNLEYAMKEQVLNKLNKAGVEQISVYYGKEVSLEYEEKEKENFRASIGEFVSELVEHVDYVIEEKKEKSIYGYDKKFALYCGHDTTIVPLLYTFDIFDGDWPEYCANIIIEVWKGEEVEVRILYNGQVKKVFSEKEWEKFAEIFEKEVVSMACTPSDHEIEFLEENKKIMEGSIFG